MKIEILGTGCPKCNLLEEATRQAVANAGLDATVEKVTDMAQIMAFGVMSTPALVVDGEVKLSGRVPSVDDLAALLTRA